MTQPGTAIQTEGDANDFIGIPREMLDCLPVIVMTIDMQTHEIVFANTYMTSIFGDVAGKICWRVLQKDQVGPCSICSDRQLVDEKGTPLGSLRREIENTITGRRYDMIESALITKSGRLVKIGIAVAIDEQKHACSLGSSGAQAFDSGDADLKELVVMCANCKKIRGREGQWLAPAVFLRTETGFEVSHGLCVDCAARLYPDL